MPVPRRSASLARRPGRTLPTPVGSPRCHGRPWPFPRCRTRSRPRVGRPPPRMLWWHCRGEEGACSGGRSRDPRASRKPTMHPDSKSSDRTRSNTPLPLRSPSAPTSFRRAVESLADRADAHKGRLDVRPIEAAHPIKRFEGWSKCAQCPRSSTGRFSPFLFAPGALPYQQPALPGTRPMNTLTTLAVIGVLAILGAIAAAVFFFGGFYNVAATEEDPAVVTCALVHIRRASIARQSTDTPPLSLDDAAVVQEGARAFSQRGCVNCHGAPGVNWAKFSEGLRPDPPHLKELVDALRPQDLFWGVQHCIHMTGMPSVGRIE